MMMSPQFTITAKGSAVIHAPRVGSKSAVKFDAEFIERRMREHREWCSRFEAEIERDIIAEVLGDRERKQ